SDVADESFADLHRVEGLRGIYIASQVVPALPSASSLGPEHLTTLISFDHGAEWGPVQPPSVDHQGRPVNCNVVSRIAFPFQSCGLLVCEHQA
ncbi:Putative low-density lipoprotein receptor, partial [Gryllus bimaculatus]